MFEAMQIVNCIFAGLLATSGLTSTVSAVAVTQFCRPGLVLAIALQDDGKVVIGGSFSLVNGVARNNIARLNPDGSLDRSWNPNANGALRQMVIAGGDLFVMGDFTAIGGESRDGVAKLSLSSAGQADPLWDPAHAGNLHALAVSGTNIYVGGFGCLARLSTTGTGDGESPWGPQPDLNILVLAASGTNLYVGGDFSQLGDMTMRALVKVSALGAGDPDPGWDAMVRGPFGPPVTVLAVSGSELIIGGSFDTVGGLARTNLARVSLADGGEIDNQWNPNMVGTVTAWSETDGVAAGKVYCLATEGTNLYVGGSFCAAGALNRTNLAKVSAAGSGEADPAWAPSLDGLVTALTVSSNAVYVGGNFGTVNGASSPSLAKLDAITGELDSIFVAQVGYLGSASCSLSLNQTDGLTLSGIPGGTYQIQYTDSLTPPVNWISFTNVTLTSESMTVPGTKGLGNNQRFFQAQLLP
jgi:hypothetical protein